MSTKTVVVEALRTPMGRAHKGRMAHARPDDLGAFIAREVLSRFPQIPGDRVDDVIAATAFPEAEQGYNLGRVVGLLAGLPDSVPGMQLNRWCASGLEAVATADAKIQSGVADCILAVGIESMTAVPMGGHDFAPNPTLSQIHPDMYLGMGLTAENLVDLHKISREDQDAFALESHRRAIAAEEAGQWDDERVPYPLDSLTGIDGDVLATDEGPRGETTLEALGGLKPVFRADGSVTAGNSSPLTDGAAAVLVVSEKFRDEFDLPTLGRLESYAAAGVPPEIMGIGPVAAVPKALERCGWKQDELGAIELNEAFAAQSLAVIRELGLDTDRVNRLGGAIALGHPLGCTGARLVATLLHQMKRDEIDKGMVTMCVGGGMGAAGCFSRGA